MDIDYANVFALTVYGKIGVKVWICKGEVLTKRDLNPNFVGGKTDVSDRRERRDMRSRDRRRPWRRGGERRQVVPVVVENAEAAEEKKKKGDQSN